MLILKYDAAVSLKINPLIKEVLRNLTALCGKLLLERIHICGTCYMNCKSTAVDDRHIVVCKVSKRNNCSNLLVTDGYRYLLTQNNHIKAVRILIRLTLDRNHITDRVSFIGRLYLKDVHRLKVIVIFLEDISVCLEISVGKRTL